MDPQALLNHFETIADAPGGLQGLRDLVLDLAVQGRLVEQDPSEGEGRDVLDAGCEALAEAAAKGWTRPQKLSAPTTEEIPFAIPLNWTWARLPMVSHGLGQQSPASSFTYIDVSSVNGKDGSLNSSLAVVSPDEAPSRARKIVVRDVVLYSTIRPYLRNVVHVDREFDPPAIASTAFAVLCPIPGINPRYLKTCLRSAYFSRFVESRQKGIAYPAINDGDLAFGLIPVPPRDEQDRIVVKVDELMALCDQLHVRQEGRRRATTRLRSSALHALTEAETTEDLQAAWQRVNSHWAGLTGESASIADLRRSIFVLAVKGRLTTQESQDQPAREFLASVVKQQLTLKSEGRLRGVRVPVLPTSLPAPLIPATWQWTRLGSVLRHCRNGLATTPNDDGAGFPLLRISAATSNSDGVVDLDDHKFADIDIEAAAPYVLDPGDLLACRFNGNLQFVGRVAIVPSHKGTYLHPDKLIRIRAISLDHRFLAIALSSAWTRSQIEDAASTTAGNIGINGAQLQALHIPIPPLAEQARISDRVEVLLGLCTRLEQSMPPAERAADRVAAGAVHKLVGA